MAKEYNYMKEFKKINYCLYIIMALLLILSIVLLVNSCSNSDTITEDTYDVSMMHEVGVSDIVDMFANEGTYVLYIGRETCKVCHDLLPILTEAQINNNYITQYLDISNINRNSSDFTKLVELLDVEVTTTVSEDGTGEEKTDTFGNFLRDYGFTPCVIIISEGKQLSGFFGTTSLISFEDWLSNYGI